jgi:hypothetical protein
MAKIIKPGQTDYPMLYLSNSTGNLSLADDVPTLVVKKNGLTQSPGAGVVAPTIEEDETGDFYQVTVPIPGSGYADDEVVTIVATGLMDGLTFATTVAEYRIATSDLSDVAAAAVTIAGYLDTEIAAIKVVTDLLSTMISAGKFTAEALENTPTGGAGGTVEGMTEAEVLTLILCAVTAKLSGAESGNIKVRDLADTKDRLTITSDGYGNRLSVVVDAS